MLEKQDHIKQLDVFRALAALSVCAVHFTYESFFHKYFLYKILRIFKNIELIYKI